MVCQALCRADNIEGWEVHGFQKQCRLIRSYINNQLHQRTLAKKKDWPICWERLCKGVGCCLPLKAGSKIPRRRSWGRGSILSIENISGQGWGLRIPGPRTISSWVFLVCNLARTHEGGDEGWIQKVRRDEAERKELQLCPEGSRTLSAWW